MKLGVRLQPAHHGDDEKTLLVRLRKDRGALRESHCERMQSWKLLKVPPPRRSPYKGVQPNPHHPYEKEEVLGCDIHAIYASTVHRDLQFL